MEYTEQNIMGLFSRLDVSGCITAREMLKDIFTKLPINHPLVQKYEDLLIEYNILDVENGN